MYVDISVYIRIFVPVSVYIYNYVNDRWHLRALKVPNISKISKSPPQFFVSLDYKLCEIRSLFTEVYKYIEKFVIEKYCINSYCVRKFV